MWQDNQIILPTLANRSQPTQSQVQGSKCCLAEPSQNLPLAVESIRLCIRKPSAKATRNENPTENYCSGAVHYESALTSRKTIRPTTDPVALLVCPLAVGNPYGTAFCFLVTSVASVSPGITRLETDLITVAFHPVLCVFRRGLSLKDALIGQIRKISRESYRSAAKAKKTRSKLKRLGVREEFTVPKTSATSSFSVS